MLESDEISMDEALKVLEEFDVCFVKTMRESYATQKHLDTVNAKVINLLLFGYTIDMFDMFFAMAGRFRELQQLGSVLEN